jgi:hypothetical protein
MAAATAYKSAVKPFVLASVLGIAALCGWAFAIAFTASAPAACNNVFSVGAEIASCRWPAIFVALGWIAFTAAVASAWVGGVRMQHNRSLNAGSGRRAPLRDAARRAEA